MTGCDRIMAVLADGEWHDTRELYRLGTVAHSRISDLRKRGHRVEHRVADGCHEYRLVVSTPGPATRALSAPSPGPVSPIAAGPGVETTTLRDRVGQLILFGAAA